MYIYRAMYIYSLDEPIHKSNKEIKVSLTTRIMMPLLLQHDRPFM